MTSPDPLRVLVVDDDDPILLLMRSVLKEFQFEPLTARSGEQAISIARDARPDVILLDLHMPGRGGREVIQELQDDPVLRAIPVIFLTGQPLSSDEIVRSGAVDAVQKPFDLEDLIGRIHTHARQAR